MICSKSLVVSARKGTPFLSNSFSMTSKLCLTLSMISLTVFFCSSLSR